MYLEIYNEVKAELIAADKQELFGVMQRIESNVAIKSDLKLYQEVFKKWRDNRHRNEFLSDEAIFKRLITAALNDPEYHADFWSVILKQTVRRRPSEIAFERCGKKLGVEKIVQNHIMISDGNIVRSSPSRKQKKVDDGVDVDFATNIFPGFEEAFLTLKHTSTGDGQVKDSGGTSQNNQIRFIRNWIRNAESARRNSANQNIAFVAISEGEYGRRQVLRLRDYAQNAGIFVMNADEFFERLSMTHD